MNGPARPLVPADAFHLFEGHWHLDRTIPGQATMRGHATVVRQTPATVLYTEQVELETARGARLTGTAHYCFTRCSDSSIDVHLHTGAHFHTLRFNCNEAGHLEAHATHQCAADTYTSTYCFTSPTQLIIEHHVQGPRKCYTSHTTLTRDDRPT